MSTLWVAGGILPGGIHDFYSHKWFSLVAGHRIAAPAALDTIASFFHCFVGLFHRQHIATL